MKAEKNCHTCRERKIGCDRTLPRCRNCQRSSRICRGYGLKLSWPDDNHDGRRKALSFDLVKSQDSSERYIHLQGGLPFLNTTFQDISNPRRALSELHKTAFNRIPPNLDLGVLTDDMQGGLLSYYEDVLSRMITTIDDAGNGFRNALLPLALSSKDLSSQALLKATLALSAFHLGRQELAVQNRLAALKALSASINSGTGPEVAQLAACMMLCVNSVFDASDDSWTIHLQGARTLAQDSRIAQATGSHARFLLDWFAYHDVLQDYTLGRGPGNELGIKDKLAQTTDPADLQVIGLLGCSREVLNQISYINYLRSIPQESRSQLGKIAENIRHRLQNLQQVVQVKIGSKAGTLNMKRITITADFYRKAALLYLEQVMLSLRSQDGYIEGLMDECFKILDQLVLCTSPWPLFILASWCTKEEHRAKILIVLEAMNEMRRIQNVEVIESIIKTLWRQVDLCEPDKRYHTLDWRDLVDTSEFIPSFI